MSDDSDPIRVALRAEADEARAEIREAGIVCPSCGANMADLSDGHMLTLSPTRSHEDGPGGAVVFARQPMIAKCADGEAVELMDAGGTVTADFETFKAATNINLWDTFRHAESASWERQMTGFLGMVQ